MTAVFAWGTVAGGCVVGLVAWLSMPILIRRGVARELREIRRISRGLTDTGERFALNDRDGALAQARSAYVAVYPGAGKEPDPGWVAWVFDRPAFLAADEYPDIWDTDAPATPEHAPRHAAAAPEPVPYPDWPRVVTAATPPQWGEPPPGQIEPLRWAGWELALAWLVLGGSHLSAAARRHTRAAIDGLWVALAVFEASGQRVNHAFLESLDDILEGIRAVVFLAIEVGEILADRTLIVFGRVARLGRVLATPLIGRPSQLRPKRYYPIKEG